MKPEQIFPSDEFESGGKKMYFCAYSFEPDEWWRVKTPPSDYVCVASEFEALDEFVSRLKIEKGIVVSRISIRNPNPKRTEDDNEDSIPIPVFSKTRNRDVIEYHNGGGIDLIGYDGERFFVGGKEVARDDPIYRVLEKIVYLERDHLFKMSQDWARAFNQQTRQMEVLSSRERSILAK